MLYIYIFGYGSLISPRGINSRGCKKIYTRDDFIICRLVGYQREWNALWSQSRYLGLRLASAAVNGVIFKLYDEDQKAFLQSEASHYDSDSKNLYRLTDVTENIYTLDNQHILLDNPEDRVFTCVTVNPTSKGSIPQYYTNLLQDYLKEYDESFVNEFNTTTK